MVEDLVYERTDDGERECRTPVRVMPVKTRALLPHFDGKRSVAALPHRMTATELYESIRILRNMRLIREAKVTPRLPSAEPSRADRPAPLQDIVWPDLHASKVRSLAFIRARSFVLPESLLIALAQAKDEHDFRLAIRGVLAEVERRYGTASVIQYLRVIKQSC
jgi:hypothetical protein